MGLLLNNRAASLIILLFIFLAQPTKITGQSIFPGACPTPTPIPNLNRQSYSGVWYLIQKYESGVGHAFSCALAHYLPPAIDGTWNGLQNFTERLSGIEISIPATVSMIGTDGSGFLNADSFLLAPTLPQSQLWDVAFTLRQPYSILATDYCTYTVEWSCITVGAINLQFLWIFSRTRTLSPQTLDSIKVALQEENINTSRLVNYDTSGCVLRQTIPLKASCQ